MLPTRAASAFHAAVHDLRVARLARAANAKIPKIQVQMEGTDYAALLHAVVKAEGQVAQGTSKRIIRIANSFPSSRKETFVTW
jgi:hypothetical protein